MYFFYNYTFLNNVTTFVMKIILNFVFRLTVFEFYIIIRVFVVVVNLCDPYLYQIVLKKNEKTCNQWTKLSSVNIATYTNVARLILSKDFFKHFY